MLELLKLLSGLTLFWVNRRAPNAPRAGPVCPSCSSATGECVPGAGRSGGEAEVGGCRDCRLWEPDGAGRGYCHYEYMVIDERRGCRNFGLRWVNVCRERSARAFGRASHPPSPPPATPLL